MKSYEKRFYLITSGTQPSNLPIKERYIIDAQLVNQWDSLGSSDLVEKGLLLCGERTPQEYVQNTVARIQGFEAALSNRIIR